MGMRNPFRIHVDRETNELWVADVGEEALEEINRLGVDESFGRTSTSAGRSTPAARSTTPTSSRRPPAFHPPPATSTTTSRGGAVIGGTVYRAPSSELAGNYLFTDLCSKALLGLRGADGGYEEFTLATIDESQIVSVDSGNDGRAYPRSAVVSTCSCRADPAAGSGQLALEGPQDRNASAACVRRGRRGGGRVATPSGDRGAGRPWPRSCTPRGRPAWRRGCR